MSTIVPLTPEGEWLSRLHDLPVWTLPLIPTVIVAPHPDDETLGAGGMIAVLRSLDIAVSVLAVSDGENSYAGAKELGKVREGEQNEALARLDVSVQNIHRLRFPDRELAAWEGEVEKSLSSLVSCEMHIVAPWPRDFHPDHEACGRAAERVGRSLGLQLSFYLFWTWHRGVPGMLDGLSLVSLPLTGPERRRKLYALEAHESQFQYRNFPPILSPELLQPAERDFEVYLV